MGQQARGMLRAYIESNLAFMRDHRNNAIAMVEIAGSTEGRRTSTATLDVVDAVRVLEHRLFWLPRQRASSVLTSTPHVLAIAIRAAIEAASPRLALDPKFDIGQHASQIVYHLRPGNPCSKGGP